jgi:hypothetical protein
VKNGLILASTLVLSQLLTTPAHADESLFAYITGADIVPKGQGEAVLVLTRRTDKDFGTYRGNDATAEIEYGVSDKFSAGFFVGGFNLKYKNAFAQEQVAPGVFEDVYPQQFSGTRLSRFGVSGKYQFLSPYTDGIGLTVRTELYYQFRYGRIDGAKTKQVSFEPNIILQKNFLDDTLITTVNLKAEFENRKFTDGEAENEIKFEPGAGISYRFAKGLYLGGEGFYRADNLNGKFNHGSIFVGPTIHYGAKKFYITGTFQRQVTGTPSYSYDTAPQFQNRGVNLEEETRNEIRVKIGVNF